MGSFCQYQKFLPDSFLFHQKLEHVGSVSQTPDIWQELHLKKYASDLPLTNGPVSAEFISAYRLVLWQKLYIFLF